jgi:RHS repeat-associated protein
MTPFNGGWTHPLAHPGSSGGWVPWTVKGVLEDAGDEGAFDHAVAELSGNVFFPPQNESFTFDEDGNRESSALWNYGWNGRNQLVRARTKTWDSAPQGWDVSFDYDAEGRRFKKTATRYEDGDPVEQKVIYFVWDGWDLLYERHEDIQGNVLLDRRYVWGPDIADGAAGGAGGLLLIREKRGTIVKDYYPLFDGTGHVVGLTDITGALQAEYWWAPFGELISSSGPKAQSNPWRFQTKYFDEETGLYYFGQRYYDPTTGQWLSRDPLGESESLNLYSYCHNDPVNNVDVGGLASVSINGSLSTTLETLIPILTDSPFDDMDSNSGIRNTVPVPDSPLYVINLALAAIEVEANALPPLPVDWHSPFGDQLWAMTATTRQLDSAADSGNFDAATTRMFRQTSQTRSNAAHDWQILSGTAQGVTFITQPEAVLFKGAAAGLIGLKLLGRAGTFADEAVELGWNASSGGRFGGVVGENAFERSFLNNAQATFREGSVFTNATRHRGNIVIQRSDIPLSRQNVIFMRDGNSPLVMNAAGQWETLSLHHVGRMDGKLIEVFSSHNTFNPTTGGWLHIPGPGGPLRQTRLSQSYWQQRLDEFIESGLVSDDLLRILGK